MLEKRVENFVMKRIGLYGGSFDPVHFGHISFAIEMLEKHALDEVWFILAKKNPLKSDFPANASHRLKMLEIALEPLSYFVVKDDELKRASPSYTIDTVESIVADHSSGNQFFFLIGKDALCGFNRWHRVKELISLVPILIGERSCDALLEKDAYDPEIHEALSKGTTKIRLLDINSTEIRQRISNCLYCGHLVPEKVLDYIYNNGLYSDFNF